MFLCCMAAIVAAVMTKLGFAAYIVQSASMEPTLHCASGPRCERLAPDQVLANRWAYHFRSVQRRDVVVLQNDHGWCGSSRLLIKRVVGVPGDTVAIDHGRVYVNGRLEARRAAGANQAMRHYHRSHVRLAHGRYFVVGDNTPFSCDSRVVGTIPRSMIVALAVLVRSPSGQLRLLR